MRSWSVTWEWLERTGRTIMGQFRRLGASLDYSRERFTMDDDYVRAVMTFFVRLWDRGWIYRANRIVNWCPFHQTAISDLEVVHEEMDDTLFTIRYPFADGDGRDGISIATVRPATILADVAVAVHPDDPRYRAAIGREVVVPYSEQRVPVIADERIDREFGTGALKVTPGHDLLDFEIGRDHGLPEPMVIGRDGRMSEAAGELAGLTQEEAGARVARMGRGARPPRETRAVPALRRHLRALPFPHRAADLAAVVVRDGASPRSRRSRPCRERRVRFHPESQHRFAITSLEKAPDWCISRQLWWGHQLPIWYCPDGHTPCRVEEPDGVRGVRLVRARARVRRPRHVVLVRALAVRHARLAGRHARARALLPRQLQLTAREIIRLWENRMIWTGSRRGRRPVHRRDHPLDGARARRAAHVQEPRHGHRSDGADRGVRRRRRRATGS